MLELLPAERLEAATPALAELSPERLTGAMMRDWGVEPQHVSAVLVRLGVTIPRIPGYTLLAPVGRGGNGVVWRGVRGEDGIPAAVKISRAGEPTDDVRFLREARTAANVIHARLVPLFGAGVEGDRRWLALAFQPGGDANDLVSRHGGRLPPLRALRLVIQAADGLSALHAAGLVHRDCTPGNIFLAGDGGALLGDLGLVRGSDERLTRTGVTMGTPAYLSPEQARGDEVDARSDLFGLGASLYALVVGRAPFAAASLLASAAAAAKGTVPDPRDLVPDLDPRVAIIILHATAREPAARYATARELIADGENVLAGGKPMLALRGRGGHRPARRRSRSPRSAIPLALVAGCLVTLVIAMATGRGLISVVSAPAAEDRLLADQARLDPSAEGWRAYLARFPHGRSADEARSALTLHTRVDAAQADLVRRTTDKARLAEASAVAASAARRAPLQRTLDGLLAQADTTRTEIDRLRGRIARRQALLVERQAGVDSALLAQANNKAFAGTSVLLARELAVHAIILDPDDNRRILIAHEEGILSSEDSGATWVDGDPLRFTPPKSSGFTISPYAEVNRAQWRGDRLWLDAGGWKLCGLLSLDRGRSFKPIALPPFPGPHPNPSRVGSILLGDGTIVISCRSEAYLARSSDQSATWSFSPLGAVTLQGMWDGPDGLVLASDQGLSTDGGRTWSPLVAPGAKSALSLGEHVFVEEGGGIDAFASSLLRLDRHGRLVESAKPAPTPLRQIIRDPLARERLYAISDGLGLLHSPDGGSHWFAAHADLPAARKVKHFHRQTLAIQSVAGRVRLLWQGADSLLRALDVTAGGAKAFTQPVTSP